MITSIKVTNHLNESLTIELMKPEESGFIVLSIDGLGPPKAEISLTERAGIDGAAYNSARATPRDAMLRLRYYPDGDTESKRQLSYKYFPIKRPITLEFTTGNRLLSGLAYVEANEPDIFSRESGCAITLRFPDSYLYDIATAVTIFSAVTPSFEFPWSNESTTLKLLVMSEYTLDTVQNIPYYGDASTGMLLHIHALGSASGFSMTHMDTLATLAIDSTKLAATTGSDIVNGDDFWISTVKGHKYAILIRDTVTYNILNCLGLSPAWHQLEKGDNLFAYSATSGLVNLQFVVYNAVAYEGI